MSLIQCPECGENISSYSDNCINCGFPLYKTDILEKDRIASIRREYKKFIDNQDRCRKTRNIQLPPLPDHPDKELIDMAREAYDAALSNIKNLSAPQLYELTIHFVKITSTQEAIESIRGQGFSSDIDCEAQGKIAAISTCMGKENGLSRFHRFGCAHFDQNSHDGLLYDIFCNLAGEESVDSFYPEYFSSLKALNADMSTMSEVMDMWAEDAVRCKVDPGYNYHPSIENVKFGQGAIDRMYEMIEEECDSVIDKVREKIRSLVQESYAEQLGIDVITYPYEVEAEIRERALEYVYGLGLC